jgi:hypothetical protein
MECALSALREGYWTQPEFAAQVKRTERTLERWRSEGKGPPVTWLGQEPIYRIEAAQAWLRSLEKPMPRERRRRVA